MYGGLRCITLQTCKKEPEVGIAGAAMQYSSGKRLGLQRARLDVQGGEWKTISNASPGG